MWTPRLVRAVVAGTVAVALVGGLTLPSRRSVELRAAVASPTEATMLFHRAPSIPLSGDEQVGPVTPGFWQGMAVAFAGGVAAGGAYALGTYLLSLLRAITYTDNGGSLTEEQINDLLGAYSEPTPVLAPSP
jgi:hypothetical protein